MYGCIYNISSNFWVLHCYVSLQMVDFPHLHISQEFCLWSQGSWGISPPPALGTTEHARKSRLLKEKVKKIDIYFSSKYFLPIKCHCSTSRFHFSSFLEKKCLDFTKPNEKTNKSQRNKKRSAPWHPPPCSTLDRCANSAQVICLQAWQCHKDEAQLGGKGSPPILGWIRIGQHTGKPSKNHEMWDHFQRDFLSLHFFELQIRHIWLGRDFPGLHCLLKGNPWLVS